MCGLFMLGMYTRRANGMGAVTGALTGAIGLYLVKTYTSMHFLLYTIVGIGLCIIVGYLMSLVIGGKQTHIEGLTVYTLNKDPLKRENMRRSIGDGQAKRKSF